MRFIKTWIEKGYITSATARAIELWILGTLSAFVVWALDNLDVILQGGSVDRQTFIITFGTSTALTITARLKKRARDIAIHDSELI